MDLSLVALVHLSFIFYSDAFWTLFTQATDERIYEYFR